MKATNKSKSFDFETALAELTGLVQQMEHGDLKLEDALKRFERGIELSRECQIALQTAEQKVQILIEKSTTAALQPYNDPEITPHDDK